MYCYGSGAGYGRFIDRVEQPLFVPGQKTNKSGNRKATSCRHVRCVETGEIFEKVSEKNETNDKQLKCYAIMATAQGGVRPAMVLTDEREPTICAQRWRQLVLCSPRR